MKHPVENGLKWQFILSAHVQEVIIPASGSPSSHCPHYGGFGIHSPRVSSGQTSEDEKAARGCAIKASPSKTAVSQSCQVKQLNQKKFRKKSGIFPKL